MNVTFFPSHFLQAEVNDSGTQAETNECDRSLALRKKERKKCHQMVFSLGRKTGLGAPESLRHRAPACAAPWKHWSNLVTLKGVRSQSHAQFNMENSTYPSILYCFYLQKINWKKNLMIRSYNKVHVSNRTKKMLSVVWNFQMKTLLKGKKNS